MGRRSHSCIALFTNHVGDRGTHRYIAHNGEINTLRGNINWMHARQALFDSELFGEDIKKILPIINPNGSDSSMFDNTLELLVLAGRPLAHAMMMMIPEPWSNHETMDDERRAFYQYLSCLMEPWDGPASIGFTDGKQIGAILDRNGLAPRVIMSPGTASSLWRLKRCARHPFGSGGPKGRLQPAVCFSSIPSRAGLSRTRKQAGHPTRSRIASGSTTSGTPRRLARGSED